MRAAKGLTSSSQALALSVAACVVFAIVAGGGGCELAVSDTIPPFSCVPGAKDTCPVGSVCAAATHECVAAAESCSSRTCAGGFECDPQTRKCTSVGSPGGSDSAVDGAGQDATAPFDSGSTGTGDATPEARGSTDAPEASDASVTEATIDAPGPCRGVTCKCGSPSDCQSGICADTLTVTQALYAANMNTSFCTQSCCTSADCPSSTVCFGTGAGGSYCVAPSWVGRKSPGAAIGGASCTADSDCRSGLCAAGACADTCCSTAQQSSECATGSICRFAAFPGSGFDIHETAWCGAPLGNGSGGSPCAVDAACQSGKCAGFTRCQSVCRSSADCGGLGQACVYGLGPGALMSTKDIIPGCLTINGAGAEGASCTLNTDCQSNFCDGTHCTDVCFADSDCRADWHCRPKMVSVQSGGSYSVLCCQG